MASRLDNRVQLTTDGLRLYVNAVETAFAGDIDYAVLHKLYDAPGGADNERRPPSAPESRFGRSTASPIWIRPVRHTWSAKTGFSKKVENLAHAVSPHYMNYNFARPHATLTKDAGGHKVTPAMAAGIENRLWTAHDIAALLDWGALVYSTSPVADFPIGSQHVSSPSVAFLARLRNVQTTQTARCRSRRDRTHRSATQARQETPHHPPQPRHLTRRAVGLPDSS
ncbi:hypothetical protein H7J74_25860 [Mycobacterium angelicum]|nr:hypothetical protein [Mycobacterium angelicum]MCV7199863.1 hypothetical protein [Mycobacterium angelicum]